MCTDFGPLFQKKFHEKVYSNFILSLSFSSLSLSEIEYHHQLQKNRHLFSDSVSLSLWKSPYFQLVPSLLQILDDNSNPRVQAHGAAALVNFSEECPKVILSQYLDVIILKLEEVLNSKFKEASISSLIKMNQSTMDFIISTKFIER